MTNTASHTIHKISPSLTSNTDAPVKVTFSACRPMSSASPQCSPTATFTAFRSTDRHIISKATSMMCLGRGSRLDVLGVSGILRLVSLLPSLDREICRVVCSAVITPRTQIHARKKKNLQAAFSIRALASQEAIIQECTDAFIAKIGPLSRNEAGIDMVEWFEMNAFDLLGEMGFGESFGCIDQGKLAY